MPHFAGKSFFFLGLSGLVCAGASQRESLVAPQSRLENNSAIIGASGDRKRKKKEKTEREKHTTKTAAGTKDPACSTPCKSAREKLV